ncbi:MAG: AAA family ATPase [Acetobacteraceae bacterium]|nr:AAA family ATPase [Acetobacteraceae bacterium]
MDGEGGRKGEDLFARSLKERLEREAPLALRMRPRSLEEFVGQEHIVGPGRLLRRAIQADQLSSAIFFGPTGSGKTALARIIADTTQAHFEQINAVTAGVADIRRVVEEAAERRAMHRRRTILFIDEIHRFNRAQQDALLPAVEDGTVILIGATTENPFFEVNPPLVSRSRVFAFQPLSEADIRVLLERALRDSERGLGGLGVEVDPEALDHLVRVSNGDARSALNALELAALTTLPGPDGRRRITLEVAAESIQRRAIQYDRAGDQHFDHISAFIKSMRGSDPDAALYWLARMLYAGEDPSFIARRVLICAAEDVGLADPQALVVAAAAAQAVEYVGLPEAKIPLAMAAVYVACAPKSNSAYLGIGAAMKDVEERKIAGVPVHLRVGSYPGAARLGHGQGYRYAHDYPGHWVEQEYLPRELLGRVYYRPGDLGFEAEIKRRLGERGKAKPPCRSADGGDEGRGERR